MSKDYGYPSFELICRASSGDELAIREILKFYDTYILNYACVLFTTLKVVKSLCRLMKN
jgi:hypothetical protein